MRYKDEIEKRLEFADAILRDMERNIQRGRVTSETWLSLQSKMRKTLADVKKFIELELD